ncbi:MAG TPA: hypothetical protein VFE58_03435 [Tepidisphaeraceae bacterium]|jgi:hypothetical protein|nr:hypothetical protein [Tepidisphaeraceae bacterium]
MRPIGELSICPLCFTRYPLSVVNAVMSICPECDSEGISIDLVSFDEFLRDYSMTELQTILTKWGAATGFYESYKASKRRRIEDVIKDKAATIA